VFDSKLFGGRCGGGFGGVELRGELRTGDDFGGVGVGGFVDLDAEDVAGAEHIAGEEDDFLVGREADVGLETVVVVGHVDEVLGVEYSGLPEGRFVECSFSGDLFGVEELDPFAVGRFGYLAGVAAVAGRPGVCRC
jgi:hypothetical protein